MFVRMENFHNSVFIFLHISVSMTVEIQNKALLSVFYQHVKVAELAGYCLCLYKFL